MPHGGEGASLRSQTATHWQVQATPAAGALHGPSRVSHPQLHRLASNQHGELLTEAPEGRVCAQPGAAPEDASQRLQQAAQLVRLPGALRQLRGLLAIPPAQAVEDGLPAVAPPPQSRESSSFLRSTPPWLGNGQAAPQSSSTGLLRMAFLQSTVSSQQHEPRRPCDAASP